MTARSAVAFWVATSPVHRQRTAARRWAAAFHRNGFRGLRHRLRGDVSQRLAGWALFGTAGLRRRAPNGMATAVRPLDRLEVVRVLDRLGVELRPIPAVVPIASPSTPRR